MYKKLSFIYSVILFLLVFINVNVFAANIDTVIFEGNKRIPDSRITPHLIKPAKNISVDDINESIKKLYGTGLFLNIDTDLYVDKDKFVLKYILEEMPLIGNIIFQGNKDIKTKTLQEGITLKSGSVLSFAAVEKALESIRLKYEEENRYGTKVGFKLESNTVNSVDIIFEIKETGKAQIYNIYTYGNEHISREDILKAIPTKEKGFWSIISGSGKIAQEMMDADREVIRFMYLEKGYAKVTVGDPELVYHKDNKSMADLYFRIQEGEQYKVRSVDISGYENIERQELEKVVKLKKGDIFNIKLYQEDILKLTDIYTSKGYAYANVEPIVNLDDETREVDITYKIEESILVYIGRINITGNNVTFDNVIRRQIDQMEGALYNSRLIREAKANTMATGFFENVQIVERNVTDDVIDLDVEVKEQSTGTFTLGAAYSTVDGLLGMVQLSRNNFMGWGHSVSLRAEVSQKRMDFFFSYTDPWLFDWPVSGGVDIFNLERDWYEYTRSSLGGSIRLGHAIIKRRLFMNYRLAFYRVNIYDIDSDASKYVWEQAGVTQTHSLSPSILWNSLDNPIDPTRGNKSQFSVDLAGTFLGGDTQFVKILAETTQYVPIALDGDLTFMFHAEAGYLTSIKQGVKIPIDERFRLGGINSVRGFDYGEISPLDSDGHPYGGNKYYQFNVEFIFPIKKDIKLKGLFFVDVGQALAEHQDLFSIEPRASAGAGLRWVTPMGPFRIEWGYKLNRKSGETPYKFEFSIGGTF